MFDNNKQESIKQGGTVRYSSVKRQKFMKERDELWSQKFSPSFQKKYPGDILNVEPDKEH